MPTGKSQVSLDFECTGADGTPSAIPIECFTYKPADWDSERMILVHHGVLRKADEYRDHAVVLGERLHALIVAPKFDAERFPRIVPSLRRTAIMPEAVAQSVMNAELRRLAAGRWSSARRNDPVLQTLVGSLAVIVLDELADGRVERSFAEQHHAVRALLLDRAHEAFGDAAAAPAELFHQSKRLSGTAITRSVSATGSRPS